MNQDDRKKSISIMVRYMHNRNLAVDLNLLSSEAETIADKADKLYDPARGRYTSFLRQSLRNGLLAFCEKEKRFHDRHIVPDIEGNELIDFEDLSRPDMTLNLDIEVMRLAMERLEPKYRQAIEDYYLSGLTNEAIGLKNKITTNGARERILMAMRRLRKEMGVEV